MMMRRMMWRTHLLPLAASGLERSRPLRGGGPGNFCCLSGGHGNFCGLSAASRSRGLRLPLRYGPLVPDGRASTSAGLVAGACKVDAVQVYVLRPRGTGWMAKVRARSASDGRALARKIYLRRLLGVL